MLKKFRGYNTDAESRRCSTTHVGESETIQSEKDNCDINVIMKRFGNTGVLPMSGRKMEYGLFTEIFDFQSAMNAVRAGEEIFMELPSNVRERFANDPQRYLEFVSDPANVDEMVKLGIATKVAPPVEPAA